MSSFGKLNSLLQHHIANSLGWRELRPVQNLSIDSYYNGSNLVVLAPTAGGKTEAAFFPVISKMLDENWAPVSTLYLSPIKALLNNQTDRLHHYYSLVGRSVGTWHGDISPSAKKGIMANPPDCLLTTPESLESIMISTLRDHRSFFKNVKTVIIDEVHAFASGDRGWHLQCLLERISHIAGNDVRRIGLSATVGDLDTLAQWLKSSSDAPVEIIKPGGKDTEAEVKIDYVGSLENAARVIAQLHIGEKRLVFCDSRSKVEQLAALLQDEGVDTYVSHGSLGVDERRQAEQAFANKRNCVIVSTSTLELGIDVGDLDRVIQIDAPTTVASFLQRMGRTGRRPNSSRNCLFLATSDDALIKAAALVRLWKSGYVEPVSPPPKPIHIFAQQVLALSLQENGIAWGDWEKWLKGIREFSGEVKNDLSRIVKWMLDESILFQDQGVLGIGVSGEEKFGKRHFMDVLAVFSAPPLFLVKHGDYELGQVDETSFYVSKPGEGERAIILLGGRRWAITHLDWKRRIAYVKSIESMDGKSRWRGSGVPLSFEFCQSVKQILSDESPAQEWSKRAISTLERIRNEYAWVEPQQEIVIANENSNTNIWTFAGDKANSVIAGALMAIGLDCKEWDGFNISVPSTAKPDGILTKLKQLREEGLPEKLKLDVSKALEGLKFVDCLPRDIAIETLLTRLIDRSKGAEVLEWELRNTEVLN